MKKNLNTHKNVWKMATMVVMCVLLNIAAFAQSDGRIQSGTNDPVAAYLAANANTPVVRLYKADPTDAQIANAFKLSVVLYQDEQVNALTPADKKNAQKELQKLNEYIVKLDAMVQDGRPISRAKAQLNAEIAKGNSGASDNSVKKDANGVQIVTMPAQQ
jgi:hypothetical protein